MPACSLCQQLTRQHEAQWKQSSCLVAASRHRRTACFSSTLQHRIEQHDVQRSQRRVQRRGPLLCCASAAAAGNAAEGAGGDGGASIAQLPIALWKFLRPHTIRGTVLGTTAVVTRALLESPNAIDWNLLPRALLGLLALLCGNGYIVGINQIYDVSIDTINKPFLPIAAGELSTPVAWVSIIAMAATGLWIAANNFGPLITKLYAFGLALGTVYSIPPFRLKRFAVPAFAIIATVRGFLLNFGVYYATRAALQLPFRWSPPIIFITCFVTIFATVIAITKDLADVEGDKQFGIETFATRLGVRNIAFLGSGLLLLNYVAAIVLAMRMSAAFNVTAVVAVHSVLAVVLLWRTAALDRSGYTKEAVQEYYRWIWNLFYTEYIAFPFL